MSDPGAQRSILASLGELVRVFGEERVFGAAEQVFKTVARTKATVDDNVAVLLGLANVPSRAEVEKLRRQVEVLQATVLGLSRKINRLLEEAEDRAAPRPRRGARAKTPGRSRAAAVREEDSD